MDPPRVTEALFYAVFKVTLVDKVGEISQCLPINVAHISKSVLNHSNLNSIGQVNKNTFFFFAF